MTVLPSTPSTQPTSSSDSPTSTSRVGEWSQKLGTSLLPLIKTAGKVTLSSAYLVSGLSFIGLGAYTTVYSLHKSYQFYFYERPDRLTKAYDWFFTNTAPPPTNLGYGPHFHAKCESFSNWANLASGEAFCHDLANHSWKEINRPESTAAAVAFTILGGGLTLFLSSYAIIIGISLLNRSVCTFVSSIFPEPRNKN